MLRFLLDKFRQTPGPLKEARLIAGDIAEEILDLAEYYLKRAKSDVNVGDVAQSESPSYESATSSPAAETERRAEKETAQAPASDQQAPRSERSLEVTEKMAAALDSIQNKKKQEFKILAILWDADQRQMGKLTAKAVSEHGEKLAISIRHENVRKVIRMRLDKHVEIHTEQVGNGNIYKYKLSPVGKDYFENRYLK